MGDPPPRFGPPPRTRVLHGLEARSHPAGARNCALRPGPGLATNPPMAVPKKSDSAPSARRRKTAIPTGAPSTQISKPARIAITAFVVLVGTLLALILAQNVLSTMRERAAAVQRGTPEAEAERAILFEEVRQAIDFATLPFGAVDLRSARGLEVVRDEPSIRQRLQNLELVGPGELLIYRKRVGAALAYRHRGEGLDDIEGQLDFLASVPYTDEEVQAAMDLLAADGRIVWFLLDPDPEPLPDPEDEEAEDAPARAPAADDEPAPESD